MTFEARPVLADRFWIVENNGTRIGTLSKENNRYILTQNGRLVTYANAQELNRKFGEGFMSSGATKPSSVDWNVDGFPTKSQPHNPMYDVERGLPIFTKSKNSKCCYCAGYYLIKFNVNWLKGFCPKLTTLQSNSYLGPFQTEDQMKSALMEQQ
jgi:hypothetical protein